MLNLSIRIHSFISVLFTIHLLNIINHFVCHDIYHYRNGEGNVDVLDNRIVYNTKCVVYNVILINNN
jgi:hypothetical protein